MLIPYLYLAFLLTVTSHANDQVKNNPFEVDKSTWIDPSEIHESSLLTTQATHTSTCNCGDLTRQINSLKAKLQTYREHNDSCNRPNHKKVDAFFNRITGMLKNKVNSDILLHLKDQQFSSGVILHTFLTSEFLEKAQHFSTLPREDCHMDYVMTILTYLIGESYVNQTEPFMVKYSTHIIVAFFICILLFTCYFLFARKLYHASLLVFITSFIMQWNVMYQQELNNRIQALPSRCLPEVPPWYSNIFASLSGAFSIQETAHNADCARLIESQLLDIHPLLAIPPLKVILKLFSETTGYWLEDMAKHSGQAFVNFFSKVPTFWTIFVVPLVIGFLLVLILFLIGIVCGFDQIRFFGVQVKRLPRLKLLKQTLSISNNEENSKVFKVPPKIVPKAHLKIVRRNSPKKSIPPTLHRSLSSPCIIAPKIK